MAHEIDYKIFGEEMQFVEIELDPEESVLAEAGAMMYMDQKIKMNTIFGDGSEAEHGKGLMGKLLGAGKRVITGEGLFMTVFSNVADGKAHVAFASPYPGSIIPVDLLDVNGKLVCQKDAFLCAAKGVSVGIELQKKLGVGFFGGEGFIMQKLEGDGKVFLHAGGTVVKRELVAGETLRLDTGCLVAMTGDVNYDLAFAGDIKSSFFGGEGLFLATLTGPGTIWMQSLPFSRMANRIYAAAGGSKGETKSANSSLEGFSNLSNFFGN